ncbi:hypothetical protein [Geminisphaera colitermitum]|uniref:hypothetical protein n=1 Tax=Geminisphaera colitermitum TaxID=1148786 RepID=UPI000196523A|nr:hypothetical protein [Geminisphaera colitermitum]
MSTKPATFAVIASLVLLMTASTATLQAVTLSENFETQTTGATGTAAGWANAFFGDGIGGWIIEDTSVAPPETYPAIPAGNGTKSLAHNATGNNHIVRKAFGAANPFTDTDTLYFSAWAVPYSTGTGVQSLRFGTVSGTNTYMITLFTIEPDATDPLLVRFTVGTGNSGGTLVPSTQTFARDHWYEFQLVINQDTGATTPTLSLFARDVTNGETTLSAVAGLQNLSITLSSITKASTWTDWAIRSNGRQNVDNLYLSTAPIPEPAASATLVILAAAAATLAFRHYRHR